MYLYKGGKRKSNGHYIAEFRFEVNIINSHLNEYFNVRGNGEATNCNRLQHIFTKNKPLFNSILIGLSYLIFITL